MREAVLETACGAHRIGSANLIIMTCADLPISCAIEDLGRTLTGWDLGGFITTLVATLVGGLITGFIAWLAFRHEKDDRREAVFLDAVSDMLGAIGKYMTALQEYDAKALFAEEAREKTGGATDIRTHMPEVLEPFVQVQRALLRARGEEVEVITAAKDALWRGSFQESSVQYLTSGRIVTAVTEWVGKRANTTATKKVLEALPDSELLASPSDKHTS